MNNKLEIAKSLTRPIITVMLVIGCIVLVILRAVGTSDIEVPNWMVALTSGAVAWWFSDRTRKNIANGG